MSPPQTVDGLPELVFEHGIPGFRDARRFALVQVEEGPFAVLRSLDLPDVEFVVVPPMFFFADYEPEIDDDSAAELGITDPEAALLLVVVNVAEDIARSTANLLGPIVINPETRRGAQVILAGSDHKTQAPLVPA